MFVVFISPYFLWLDNLLKESWSYLDCCSESFNDAGIIVNARSDENKIEDITEIESGVNNSPIFPLNKRNGIKTIVVVRAEFMIEVFTSSSFLWRKRFVNFFLSKLKIFSIATIEESTIIPIEIEIPDNEKWFNVWLNNLRHKTENKIQSGIGNESSREILIFLK